MYRAAVVHNEDFDNPKFLFSIDYSDSRDYWQYTIPQLIEWISILGYKKEISLYNLYSTGSHSSRSLYWKLHYDPIKQSLHIIDQEKESPIYFYRHSNDFPQSKVDISDISKYLFLTPTQTP